MARKKGAPQEQAKGGEEELIVELTPRLVERAKRELAREKWLTPHKVAQRYGITVSLARKLLRELEEQGVIVLFSRNRRAPVYLPKDKAPTAPPRGL